MQNVNIRYATANDIPRINELFIQMIRYVNEQDRNSSKEVNGEPFVDGYEDGFLEKFLISSDKFILVAEKDNQVIGYLSCEEKNKIQEDSFIYLDDFCVDGSYRGYGIGTRLVQTAEEYSQKNNFGHLRLHVESGNSNSIRFYSNLGFVPVSEDEKRIFMQKEVAKKNIQAK